MKGKYVVIAVALCAALQHAGLQAQDGPKRGNVFKGVVQQNTTSGNHVTLKRYDHVGRPHFFRDAVGDPKAKHRMAGRPWERKHKGRARVGDLPYDYRLIPQGTGAGRPAIKGKPPGAGASSPRRHQNNYRGTVNIYQRCGGGPAQGVAGGKGFSPAAWCHF